MDNVHFPRNLIKRSSFSARIFFFNAFPERADCSRSPVKVLSVSITNRYKARARRGNVIERAEIEKLLQAAVATGIAAENSLHSHE